MSFSRCARPAGAVLSAAMLWLGAAGGAAATQVYNDGTTLWVGELQPGFAGDLYDSFAVIDLQSGTNWSDLTNELTNARIGMEDQTGGRPGPVISLIGDPAPAQRFLYLYRSHLQDEPSLAYVLFEQTGIDLTAWGQIVSIDSTPRGGYFCDAGLPNCNPVGSLSPATTDLRWGTFPLPNSAWTAGDVTYDANNDVLSFNPDAPLSLQGETTTYWGLSDLPPEWRLHVDTELGGTVSTQQPGTAAVPEPASGALLAIGLGGLMALRPVRRR